VRLPKSHYNPLGDVSGRAARDLRRNTTSNALQEAVDKFRTAFHRSVAAIMTDEASPNFEAVVAEK
jgi:hypothetical protein